MYEHKYSTTVALVFAMDGIPCREGTETEVSSSSSTSDLATNKNTLASREGGECGMGGGRSRRAVLEMGNSESQKKLSCRSFLFCAELNFNGDVIWKSKFNISFFVKE